MSALRAPAASHGGDRDAVAGDSDATSPVQWKRALKAAAFAFILSRAIVLCSALLAVAIAQQWGGASGTQDAIRLATPEAFAQLHQHILGNDAGWYASIVTHGYETRPFDLVRQTNWAFFPLHPLLWKGVSSTGLDLAWAGVLMANLLFLAGLFQLHRWAQLMRDPDTADRVVLCLALFPTSYFFSLPWSEPLFLVLSATSLLAIEQQRWNVATTANLLASATRPVGVLLSALLWWEARQGRRLPAPRFWLLALAGCIGLLAFMALLYQKTGNALAFADIQATWGRDGGSLTKHLRRWIMDPLLVAEAWNVRWINNGSLLLGLAASAWLWRKGHRGLALFSGISLLLPWSTGTLMSMGRYLLTIAPVFLALACWLHRPRLALGWIVASACMLAGMSACFALGATFAGA